MADLDDFFAKKDKKKSKSKKFATAEELAKKLEDTSKKSNETKIRKVASSNADGDDTNPEHQEEEWKDFEEEERKDYTGLKLGQLTISEEEQNFANFGTDGEGGSENQSDNDGNSENSDRRPSGPWKKVANTAETTAAPVAPAAVPTPESKIYVSPGLRLQTAQNLKAARLRNRTAPDISNEEYFPSLGSAPKPEPPKKRIDPGFEEVKHGSKAGRPTELATSTPVTVGNRFNSLAGDAS